MRKILIIITACLLLYSTGNAQIWKVRRIEFSGGIGTTNIYGDIGGYTPGQNLLGFKDFTFKQTRFNLNGFARYRFLDNVSARVNLALGIFHSTDVRGSNETRGFTSNTIFFEPTIQGEYYFIKNKTEGSFLMYRGKKGGRKPFFSMFDFYVCTGFGGIAYNVRPNAKLDLRGLPVSGFTAVVPVGIGINFVYSGDIKFGAELGYRYTFTDYLDGYTSIYSKFNDIYHFFSLNFIYRIKTGNF